jgi:PAS domain S-box-containing protein
MVSLAGELGRMYQSSVHEKICMARQRLDRLFTALAPMQNLSPEFVRQTQEEVADILGTVACLADKNCLTQNSCGYGCPVRRGLESAGRIDGSSEKIADTRDERWVRISQIQQMAKGLGDAVIIADEKGSIVSLNAAAQTMTGWPQDQAIGHSIEEVFRLFDETTGREYECSIDSIITSDTVTGLKDYGILLSRDGKKYVIACSGIPVRDDSGSMLRVVLIFRDVTEKAQLEDELFSQREDYQTIFNIVPQRIWYFDEKGTILRVNDYALRYLGMTREQVVGKTVYDLFPAHAQWLISSHREVISTGKPKWNETERILLPNGQWRWIRLDRMPFKNKEGQIQGVIVLVEDITEKKQSEDALRESQRALSTLMSNLPGMAYRCLNDENFTAVFASEGSLKLTGYQPSDLIQNRKITFVSLIHPDDREWVIRYIRSAVDQKTSFQCTYRIITASGKEKSVLEQGCGVYRSDGSIEALEGFITDVTDRMQALEALHASENFLRSIFASMADAIFCLDISGRFVFCNIPSDKRSILPSVNLIGKTPGDIFSPEIAKFFQDGLERNRAHEVVSGDSLLEIGQSHVWLSSKISPIFLDGEFRGSVAVVRDISKRKNMEHALRESEERYRSFVESFHGIAFRSDEQFKLTFIHGKVEQITGYTSREFMRGLVVWDYILHPDDSPKILPKVENFIRGDLSIFDQEYRIIRKDAQVRYVREIIHRLTNSATNETYFQGVVYDITEKKLVEAELNEYRDKMIRTEHLVSLGTLGSAIAHQLNQPLTAIRLFLQQSMRCLDKNTGIQNVRERIQDSLTEINNASNIISRFLQYTHLTPDDMTQKISLASIANKIVTIMADRARKAKMTLRVVGLDTMPELEAVEGEIEQIFFILVQNAIQAADAKKNSQLEISARLVDGQVELKFADTGCGISPENQRKLFQPFFTTKTEGQGTGLGLCILNRIVTRYGGKVSVESQLGIGTTFWVVLPVHS